MTGLGQGPCTWIMGMLSIGEYGVPGWARVRTMYLDYENINIQCFHDLPPTPCPRDDLD